MKLNITLIILLIGFFCFGQKEVQPYNYTLSDSEGKNPQTIIIYASAKAVNSVTFTLKNAKNEILKDKDEKEITFRVFPFAEVSFREHLVDAFLKLDEIETKIEKEKEEEKKQYQSFVDLANAIKDAQPKPEDSEDDNQEGEKENPVEVLKNRRKAIQEIRNIFQFFTALINTAFQYDTEPVAGVLKYNDPIIVTKKSINGLDTEDYFHRQAKLIRHLIYNPDPKNYNPSENGMITLVQKRKYKHIKLDKFIHFLAKENKEEREFKIEQVKKPTNFYDKITNNCASPRDSTKSKIRHLFDFKLEFSNNKIEVNTNITVNDRKGISKHASENKIDIHKSSLIGSLVDFYQNSKKGRGRKGRVPLKRNINRQLKKWYNVYELEKFIRKINEQDKDGFANEYFKFKNYKKANEKCIKKFTKLVDSTQESIKKIKNDIEVYKIKKDSINKRLLENSKDFLVEGKKKKIDTSVLTYLSNKSKEYDTIIKRINDTIIVKLKDSVKSGKKSIENWQKSLSFFSSYADAFQNHMNFLIASRRERITKVPLWNFKVNNIELDINDGFIEHITVTGKILFPELDKIAILKSICPNRREFYNNINLVDEIVAFYNESYVREALKDILDKELKFENEFPIGFSSKTDFADLNNYYLYAFEGSEKTFSLPLTNVINLYIQRHQNDRLDFSPRDQVVRLPEEDIDRNKEVELKKEKSYKLLNTRVYTDFNGLKESEPNGLVQFEAEKFVPIWTKRMLFGISRSSNFGFANYVNFNLTWAKLNEEDQELQVNFAERFENNIQTTDKYTTYLDLVRFENTSVGMDLNIASFDFPLIKTRIELNAGAHYGRIRVVDTISPNPNSTTSPVLDKKVNMIRYYPDAIVRIRPEERFGGYLRFRPFRTIVPNNEEFFAVSSAKDFINEEGNNKLSKSWLHRYELGAFYTPSAKSDNKFFFRYRYTNSEEWETNGYSEVQLGYLMYLKF